MDKSDFELQRLQKAEHKAHALYDRLRGSAVRADPLFVDNAKSLWREAVEATNLYVSGTDKPPRSRSNGRG